jgi:hypothetical protein
MKAPDDMCPDVLNLLLCNWLDKVFLCSTFDAVVHHLCLL